MEPNEMNNCSIKVIHDELNFPGRKEYFRNSITFRQQNNNYSTKILVRGFRRFMQVSIEMFECCLIFKVD